MTLCSVTQGDCALQGSAAHRGMLQGKENQSWAGMSLRAAGHKRAKHPQCLYNKVPPPDSVHQVILDYLCGFDDGAPRCLSVSCL